MKYVYTKGEWKEYRGYVFKYGKPTEVTDRATLDLIKNEADFTQVKETQDEAQEIQASDPAPVLKPKFNRSEWMKKMHAEGRMKKK